MCESCLEERLEEERRSQLVYSRAAIYVRQVDKIGALTDNLMDVPSTSALSTSTSEDPDFQVKFFLLFIPPRSQFIILREFPPFQSSIVLSWLLTYREREKDGLNSPNIAREKYQENKANALCFCRSLGGRLVMVCRNPLERGAGLTPPPPLRLGM